MPEIQTVQLSQKDFVDEFVLLACDGLWDVMDPDDAVRVTRGLLFEKKWTAKKAAARLAELAIHLGSSDNVTVIVIRFFTNTKTNG
jgi:serine/threonine protein phosphatase PrpC